MVVLGVIVLILIVGKYFYSQNLKNEEKERRRMEAKKNLRK